jgi:threonine dehydrogenase-like Zn-dependent dehydrogenase
MGHEYCGLVEEAGSAVKLIKPGQFVIGSFFASDNTCSDNTCPHRHNGYQTSCQHREIRRRCPGATAARPNRGWHAGSHARSSAALIPACWLPPTSWAGLPLRRWRGMPRSASY